VMNWVNRGRHIRTQLSGFSQKQLFLNYYYITIIYVDLKNYPISYRVSKHLGSHIAQLFYTPRIRGGQIS
jgi:hypothetical protein